ncbi:MAG: surface lipoprotein assembly modifier, partial [Paracoccaceae bacterium]
GLSVSLRAQRTRSPEASNKNDSLRLGLRYSIARPVLRTGLSLSMSLEKRDYEVSVYDPDGRQDLTLSAGVAMVFRDVSYFGFAPTLSIEASRTQSNVSLFDRENVALRLGIQSNF